MSDRKRLLGINIRVTEQEKKRILRNAKRCGLTASEYLRQLGSGHTPQAVPTPDIVEVCGMDLTDVRPAFADAALGEIFQVPIGTPLLNMPSLPRMEEVQALMEERKYAGFDGSFPEVLR